MNRIRSSPHPVSAATANAWATILALEGPPSIASLRDRVPGLGNHINRRSGKTYLGREVVTRLNEDYHFDFKETRLIDEPRQRYPLPQPVRYDREQIPAFRLSQENISFLSCAENRDILWCCWNGPMKLQLSARALAVVLTASCGAPPPPKGQADLFAFLVDGRTRKAQVLDRLGQPSGTFENGRTLTYRVGYEPATKGYFVVEREQGISGWPTWLKAKCSLVVVFDSTGCLRKHSLLEVN